MRHIAILALVLAMAGNAGAAGFRLSEQDAKATGMGNAFTAVADNASAVWYNPAAMTDLPGTNLELGTVMIAPAMSHTNADGTIDSIKNNTFAPPHAYVTQQIGPNAAIGAGMNIPFGLATVWNDKTAETRFIATESKVTDINYNASVAYKLDKMLSLAVGIDYAHVDAILDRMASPFLPGVPANLNGTGHGTGYNAAAFFKPNDSWNFGANYHSKIKVDLDGSLKTTAVTPVNTTLTLPDTMEVGAAYKYSDWLFSFDADYTDWTTYRKIVIKRSSNGSVVSTDIKDWTSVWAFRLGTEYKLCEAWKLRAGVFYDMNPVPTKHFETRVPDSDRVAWAIGTGYTMGRVTIDASYMYLRFLERTVKNSANGAALNGKYYASASMPALSVSYKF